MSLVLLCSVVPPFPCVSPWPPHLRNSSSLDPPFSSALDEDRPRHGSMEQRLLVLEFLFDSSSSRSGPPIPYSSCSSLPVLQALSTKLAGGTTFANDDTRNEQLHHLIRALEQERAMHKKEQDRSMLQLHWRLSAVYEDMKVKKKKGHVPLS
ncbi:uncharacterized protein [Triticum aestivum]|uniref:uncharacterized protein n=1 Tax=Triticum aestivum TaxID=4565 RepID=UPI0003D4E5CC|nr:uncharacterized protein LOC123125129 [Triticum aestivum]